MTRFGLVAAAAALMLTLGLASAGSASASADNNSVGVIGSSDNPVLSAVDRHEADASESIAVNVLDPDTGRYTLVQAKIVDIPDRLGTSGNNYGLGRATDVVHPPNAVVGIQGTDADTQHPVLDSGSATTDTSTSEVNAAIPREIGGVSTAWLLLGFAAVAGRQLYSRREG